MYKDELFQSLQLYTGKVIQDVPSSIVVLVRSNQVPERQCILKLKRFDSRPKTTSHMADRVYSTLQSLNGKRWHPWIHAFGFLSTGCVVDFIHKQGLPKRLLPSSFCEGTCYYFVLMEYLYNAVSLDNDCLKAMTTNRLQFCSPLQQLMKEFWDRGLLHNDLAPRNVMCLVDREGKEKLDGLRIIDFDPDFAVQLDGPVSMNSRWIEWNDEMSDFFQ